MHPAVSDYVIRINSKDPSLRFIELQNLGLNDEDIEPLIIALNNNPDILGQIVYINLSHNRLGRIFSLGTTDDQHLIEVNLSSNQIAYINEVEYCDSGILFNTVGNPLTRVSIIKLSLHDVIDIVDHGSLRLTPQNMSQHFNILCTISQLYQLKFQTVRERLTLVTNFPPELINMVAIALYGAYAGVNGVDKEREAIVELHKPRTINEDDASAQVYENIISRNRPILNSYTSSTEYESINKAQNDQITRLNRSAKLLKFVYREYIKRHKSIKHFCLDKENRIVPNNKRLPPQDELSKRSRLG